MTSKQVQLFPPELRTASIVPRWSIVFTLRQDNVAQHSYFVTFYALSIAKLLDWTDSRLLLALTYKAMVHDLDETITGDLVSPVKSEIIDEQRCNDFIRLKMKQRLPAVLHELDKIETDPWGTGAFAPRMDAIIKVADRLDALLFLIGEHKMGNGMVVPRIEDAKQRFYASWMDLLAEETEDRLQMLWNTVMMPVIGEHQANGWGHGA